MSLLLAGFLAFNGASLAECSAAKNRTPPRWRDTRPSPEPEAGCSVRGYLPVCGEKCVRAQGYAELRFTRDPQALQVGEILWAGGTFLEDDEILVADHLDRQAPDPILDCCRGEPLPKGFIVDPLHDVEAAEAGLQHPITTLREGSMVRGIRQLASVEILGPLDLGTKVSEHECKLLQVRRLGRWHDVNVLRRADVPVISDGDAADDKKLDSFPNELGKDSLDIEIRQGAVGGRHLPLVT